MAVCVCVYLYLFIFSTVGVGVGVISQGLYRLNRCRCRLFYFFPVLSLEQIKVTLKKTQL